ncbi:hypothetical protein [Dyella sp.]|uniref:hypothetical protein n=1 Tax=Dyella sp. TaxID=1869338 RepID=UPI002D766929|nr:hypothetical protein [Dyella sp.]HET7333023.1 hypothetical protein [Dyella sp.]
MRLHVHPLRSWRGVAVLAMLALASISTANASSPCSNGVQLLQFGGNVATLPPGVVGEPYQYTLLATGGLPPYTYHAASLPPGFTLSPAGVLAVTPGNLPLIGVFTASVRDHRGCSAQQTYRLAIVAPPQPPSPVQPKPPTPTPTPKPIPKPKPKPVPPAPLSTVPLEDTLAEPATPQPSMDTYVLTQAIFEDKELLAELKLMSANAATAGSMAPADEPAAASTAPTSSGQTSTGQASPDDTDAASADQSIDDDVQAQFQRLLQPLIGVQYPGRDLFAAALDTRLCRFSEALILAAARKQGRPPPNMNSFDCPPDWDKLAKQDDYMPRDPLPWKEMPVWLMSPAMRDLLLDKAQQPHPLLNPPAPQWDGAGCGCVRKLSGAIYGFYPFWQTQGKLQPLDFRLLTRINLFALWFKESGDLAVPTWTTPQQTDFIREARRHRTQLDYTLYRNDWQFLKNASDADITRITQRLAQQSADFIDAPLPDLISRSHAWLPVFAKVERVGDGLTLYLDAMPSAKDPLRPAFAHYLDQQIQALITELRQRSRPYVLNIVLRDTDLETAGSVWQVDAMYGYVRQAEAPTLQDDHIVVGSAQYRSNTNLTVRYVVLLTEPTARSRHDVRSAIDHDKKLNEDDRLVLLRKLIPVVSSGSANDRELADEMAYVSDNFGGIGFWTAPGRNDRVGQTVSTRIRASFLLDHGLKVGSQAWICEYRWPLRMAFEALLVLWLIAFALYQGSCRIRRIGLPYQLGLLFGAVGVLILGAILLAGDPALTKVREGNSLLAVLLIALIATIAYHLLKPRVEKP